MIRVDFSQGFTQLGGSATGTWNGSAYATQTDEFSPGNTNWYTGRYRYEVHYQLQLKEQYRGYTEEDNPTQLKLDNKATVYGTSDKFNGTWSDDFTVYYTPPQAVAKGMKLAQAGGRVIEAKIIIGIFLYDRFC